MIKISKEDAFTLHDKYHVKYGENGISKTLGNSKKRSYFLCETRYNMRSYNDIWKKKLGK